MSQATFWASILGAKKAIVSGVATAGAFITATLTNNGGHDLTAGQWAAAAGAYAIAHLGVFFTSNDGQILVAKLLAALSAHDTPAKALASLGIDVPPAAQLALPPATPALDPSALAALAALPDIPAPTDDAGKHEAA